MPTSNIKALINSEIHKVWEVVLNVEKYKLGAVISVKQKS